MGEYLCAFTQAGAGFTSIVHYNIIGGIYCDISIVFIASVCMSHDKSVCFFRNFVYYDITTSFDKDIGNSVTRWIIWF